MRGTCLSMSGEFKAYEAFTFHLLWEKGVNGLQACKWLWQLKRKKNQQTFTKSSSVNQIILKGAYKTDGNKCSTRTFCNTKKGPGFKLKKGQFRLVMWKKLFTMRMVKHWSRLPGNVVDAPFLETFKSWNSKQPDLTEDVPAQCRGLD